MPITRGAVKKLKQDKKRSDVNLLVKKSVKEIIKKYKHSPSPKLLAQLFSRLDTACKKNIYHANKVARLKSRLSSFSQKPKTKLISSVKSIRKTTSKKQPQK
ncbi:hypothetical protein A2Y99_03445 [Candidatus Gottesmanbacteria bacterium RBG_13_37_7]|uniref:Small ribosomal subunit protein bS20 n=1 Tax=Candidatus Gottesmanbacteria bacterium RBG_13_37_7 TaxID=1798369 RepID=A0A1F5YJG5_9BACT|nr:MAG: hypothetical protein A2Y99_03445 [Candidatus Gottesmanbacteria bacterium RBG_13_37_7]